jgi:integrase
MFGDLDVDPNLQVRQRLDHRLEDPRDRCGVALVDDLVERAPERHRRTFRRRRPSGPRRPVRWVARWRDDAGQQHSKAFDRKVDAGRYVAGVTTALAEGDYIDPAAGKVSFRDYAEKWRADQLHHRPATAAQAESRLRLWVYPVIGDQPMSTIRRSDVQRVVSLAAERNAPGTVEVIYAYTSAVFKAALLDRVVSSSPCVKIKLPERQRQRIVPLSTDQVGVIAGRVDARYRALVLVAAATGLRSGELRGLTVDRIAPALHLRTAVPAKRVTLRIDRQLAGIDSGEPVFAPAKTDAANRSVPVGASIAELLARHLAEHGPGNGGVVFSLTGGQPIDRSRAGHIWRAAADGMNLRPRSGWHDLRHHHASLLIAAGLSPRAVADRLGHKDAAETLTVYAHLWADDEDRAVDAAERAFAGVL